MSDQHTPTAIDSAIIEEFAEIARARLEGTVKAFCDKAYGDILDNLQWYLKENAVFNIGSQFDSQQRETVTACKALFAVEDATTLQEAKANAYAFRKGYWSEERAAEYHAEAVALLAIEQVPA